MKLREGFSCKALDFYYHTVSLEKFSPLVSIKDVSIKFFGSFEALNNLRKKKKEQKNVNF